MNNVDNGIHLDKQESWIIGLLDKFFVFAAICLCAYHLVSNVRPIFSDAQHSNMHLMLVFILVFLRAVIADARKGLTAKLLFDCALLFASVAACMYVNTVYLRLVTKVGFYNETDVLVGAVLLLIVVMATLYTFGKTLPVLAIIFVSYLWTGPWFPGILNHSGFTLERIITSMTINMTGVYGTVLSVSASILVIFMIFGGLLEATGGGKFFIDCALALGGRMVSGPAQAAVVSSCLMGTVNGSAIANVATTGVFTIPLMKRCGYEPEMAGALEAVASSGGSLMPPVMGVGAFILSGITGIPYSRVAIGALIPALLYYFTTSVSAHLYALHHNFKTADPSEIPDLKKTLCGGFHFLLPLVTIVYCMMEGYSAQRSGFYGIVTLLVAHLVRSLIRDPKYLFKKDFYIMLKVGLVSGAKSTIVVAPSCALMGVISNSLIMSGLTSKIIFFIKTLAGGKSILAVLMTIIVTLIFGMGVPTIASYVLVAIIGASSLIELGFPVLAVHLLIYYYAIMANLTPPVCSAVLVASQIAKSDYIKTAFRAMRIGISGFVLPLLFLYHPELLLIGDGWTTVTTTISCFFGMFALVCFFEGYLFVQMNVLQRVLALLAAILLVYPGVRTDFIGYILWGVYVLWLYRSKKIQESAVAI